MILYLHALFYISFFVCIQYFKVHFFRCYYKIRACLPKAGRLRKLFSKHALIFENFLFLYTTQCNSGYKVFL